MALNQVRPWVERYLYEHEGQCPPNLSAVARLVNASEVPRDGWGRPLRLVCPTSRPGYDYVLMSDGPDGYPGGLDRIED